MSIPKKIKIKNRVLPKSPGVYLMKDSAGRILYIGKAASLKTRVSSYFTRPADARIASMAVKIKRIDYEQTPTAIEALILESRLIKKYQPPYNVLEKDDKSFIYLVFTREDFPRPVLIRGHEIGRLPKRNFLKVYGPFSSSAAVQASLNALRRAFPWSTCLPGKKRPCFYRHLGLCPGVCGGEISSAEYRKTIHQLARFFDGKRRHILRELKRDMDRAAAERRFEDAAALRDRIRALEHLRDFSVLKRDSAAAEFIDIFGRIEGYDISNISGKQAVGSMVVFSDGEADKRAYRKFRIKTVLGPNDTAMIAEVLRRRLAHAPDTESWPLPDLILIDGGVGQLNAARRILAEYDLKIPLIGIAKGFDRKQDELVYDKSDYELSRLVNAFKPLLQRVRDEAHRFAVSYHRKKRADAFLSVVSKL